MTTLEPAAAQHRSMLGRAFFNAERLRIGWRFALALTGFLLCAIAGQLVSFPLARMGLARNACFALGEVLGAAGLVLFFRWQRRTIDRRPWSGLGLTPLRQGWKPLGVGLLLGSVAIAVVFMFQRAAGWVQIVHVTPWTEALPSLAVALIAFLGVGLSEELTFRGYLLQNAAERQPLGWATLIIGFIFGALHFNQGGFSVAFVVNSVLGTAMFVALRVQGSLWLAAGFHAAWDWTQDSVLGLSNVNLPNGGKGLLGLQQSGPSLFVGGAPAVEGGVLYAGVVLLVLLAIIAWGMARRRPIQWTQPFPPDGLGAAAPTS